jgi:PAS domain-containing protein
MYSLHGERVFVGLFYSMKTNLSELFSIQDPVARFKAQTELLARFLADEGVNKAPYFSPELPHFCSLSAAEREEVMEVLGHTLEIFEEVKSAGGTLADTPQLVWRSLRRLSWTPKSDVFDKISKSDVVEIYSTEHRGLFRNLAFYDFVSYSLEDVFARKWFDLFKREEKKTAEIFEYVNRIFQNQIRETTAPGFGHHFCYERHSPARLHYKMSIKHLSPVFKDGKVAGIVAVETCEIVGRGPEPVDN